MRSDASKADMGALFGRLLLGFVLIYFGVGELVNPSAWIGYIPSFMLRVAPPLWMILVHGWVLFVVGTFVAIGIALRTSALLAALMLASIIGALFLTGGVTSILVRDAGVLGLAVMIAADPRDSYSWDALEGRGRRGDQAEARRAGAFGKPI